MPVTNEIYDMLLSNLHITYEPDESSESRIKNEAASGMEYIKKYGDPEADFSPGTRCGQLLCDYVLRAEAGAAEMFAIDFAEEITALHEEYDVRKYAEAMGYVEEK